MGKHAEVLIIGAGAVGVCSAYYLWKKGYHVEVFDSGEIASGCSGGNAGMIVPSHVIPLATPGVIAQGLKWLFKPDSPFHIRPRWDAELVSWLWKFFNACTRSHSRTAMPVLRDLTQAGLALFDELAELPGVDFGFRKQGLLVLFQQEKGRRENRHMAEAAREMELPVRFLDQQQLRRLEPRVPTAAKGGIYFPQDAHLDPRALVLELAKYLRRHGVRFSTNTKVREFHQHGGKIIGIRTEAEETILADKIVVAAGAWSPQLCKSIGLPIPVQAGKGYSLTLEEPRSPPAIPMILSEAKVSITPLPGRRLRFAGTLELCGLDASIRQRRLRPMLRIVAHYYPQLDLKSLDEDLIWSGFRPCSPDGLPIIGPTPRHNNLILATGHAMLGITLAPITGQLVADLISGNAPSLDLRPLRPQRFF